ncbi:Mu transposase C-terminal domain-containing protein [Bradyrhizobium japonicum]|uniref:Mu transposase C-terminal domain-containing protein n=1 Tax=Bradyrhizobium japonicum TaxID=375 RepID=UPI001BA9635F|nr:Mu transposase C-terminal domain-containing protein [Bradyrhizobium japonicum]MBR0910630.1 Mu transposase C-terminal domain-containing protein [Bradyrhizobium japonicum]
MAKIHALPVSVWIEAGRAVIGQSLLHFAEDAYRLLSVTLMRNSAFAASLFSVLAKRMPVMQLVERYGVLPPPGRDEVRNIFGPRIERALDHRGVRVAGVHYQSARLQEYRRKVGDARVAVKFDPEDLGRVSVWIDDAWLTVPAIVGSLDGVHLDHWSEAIKDLRRRNLIQSSLSRHYVDAAIRDLSSMGRLALSFADVSAPTLAARAFRGDGPSRREGTDR